jgi:hypothetical protein
MLQSAPVELGWSGPMKCLRIYADESGESHLADIDIPLVPTELFPGFPPIHLSAPLAASSVRFAWIPPETQEVDWHVASRRQLAILLTGWLEIETSDGDKRRCEPGAVVPAEDTFGKGHMARGSRDGNFTMFVPLLDGLSGAHPSEGIKR